MNADFIDSRAVFLAVATTYANAQISQGELYTCWRPGGPRAPWRAARIESAIATLVSEHSVERIAGVTGTELRALPAGFDRYDITRRRA